MSQEDVFAIIKKLGGEATLKQIRDYAKEHHSGTLHLYILNRLRKLEINNMIIKKGNKWIIKNERNK